MKRHLLIFLSPDPADGGTPQPQPDPAPPAPADPPAARLVVNSQPTERELSLAEELKAARATSEQESAARKKAETDAAYAQDEARRLREIQSATPPPPTPPNGQRRRRVGIVTIYED